MELVRLIGSGGMDMVYEAHRAGGEARQRVAVKFAHVPRSAGAERRAGLHRRFLRERQMLASLRHPYIAGLIDAGTLPDGTPYTVIEQVHGTAIDGYCEERNLDQVQRIGLSLKLCDAVQCAHRNLIVHSDIKPGNLLVTPDGIPRLIDFGVASDLSLKRKSPVRRPSRRATRDLSSLRARRPRWPPTLTESRPCSIACSRARSRAR